MSGVIFKLLAVTFCFTAVAALKCYKCKIGFFNLCITSTTTCEAGEQCFSGVGTAAGFLDIKSKGCLAVADCNKTSEFNFDSSGNTTLYTLTKTCCGTDLCNGAPAGLPGALQLALASLLAVIAGNALV